MDRRGSLSLLLVLGLVSLRALAAASPLDPSWLPGVYDEADHDDVVHAALSLEGFRDDFPATLGRPTRLVAPVLLLNGPAPAPAPNRSPRSRAPPPLRAR